MSPILLLLLACGGSEPATEPPPAREAKEPWLSSPELEAHMMGHLDCVGRMWSALDHGDLDRAQSVNQEFLEHKVAFRLPGDWIPRVSAMGEAAVGVRAATTVPEAAGKAAELVTTCGDCHTAVGVKETIPAPPMAEGHAASRGQLAMLQYALIFPETHSWEAASRALADAAAKDPVVDDEWRALTERATRVVPSVRTAMAAELLTGCAGCHAAAPTP